MNTSNNRFISILFIFLRCNSALESITLLNSFVPFFFNKMATSVYKGQVPSRVKGQTTCIHHRGRQLDLYCEQCKDLACTQCLSSVHNSHAMCELREIIPQKKQGITDFVDKSENVDLVQIRQNVVSTETYLKDNASTFEKLSHDLKMQSNKLKEDLDLFTTQTLSLYKQMEEDNAKLLQTYKHDLEKYNTQLKQQIQECKTMLQRGTGLQIYDTWCEVNDYQTTIPVKPTLGTATFTSNRTPESHLKLALGKLSTSDEEKGARHGQASPDQDRSARLSTDKGHRSIQPWSEQTERTPETREEYTLLPHAKVISEYWYPDGIYSFCLTADGHLWTNSGSGNTLTLQDRKGTVLQKITHSTWMNAICLSPKTNTLWICDDNNNIMELVSGQLSHRFSSNESPRCICITADNHVIVGMAKHISKFTTNGETVLTTMSEGAEKPLVRSPHRISECPVTKNIAVVDKNYQCDGGDGNEEVVVMDTCFKKLFALGCNLPEEYATDTQKAFHICGAVYDSAGNLVLGDFDNSAIVLISGGGKFLRFIHKYTYGTFEVSVDGEDLLWSVMGGHTIKLLQYSRAH